MDNECLAIILLRACIHKLLSWGGGYGIYQLDRVGHAVTVEIQRYRLCNCVLAIITPMVGKNSNVATPSGRDILVRVGHVELKRENVYPTVSSTGYKMETTITYQRRQKNKQYSTG